MGKDKKKKRKGSCKGARRGGEGRRRIGREEGVR